MGGVKGIVLDASALLAATVDGDGNGSSASLRPGAEYLLHKLRYSKIPTVYLSLHLAISILCIIFYSS